MVSKKQLERQRAKARSDVPPPLPNRDHLERAHFALQASILLQQLAPAAASSSRLPPAPCNGRKGKQKASEDLNDGGEAADMGCIARSEISSLKKWSVHNQVKIDPALKRAFCSSCSTVLIPGITARVRVKTNRTHDHTVHQTCVHCGKTHRMPAPPISLPEPGVDGPVRGRRRARKVRCVAFHDREKAVTAEGVEAESAKGLKAKQGDKSRESCSGEAGEASTVIPAPAGHVLWAGAQRLEGWGVICSGEDAVYEKS